MGHQSSKSRMLSEDHMYKLSKTTSYSRHEIHQWYRGFLKEHPSGNLNKEEFLEIYKSMSPQSSVGTDACERAFKTFDADSDGFISFDEFLYAMSMNEELDQKKRLAYSFNMHDKNLSGKLDKDELEKLIRFNLKLLGHPVGDEKLFAKKINALMLTLDKDHNNMIGQDEFIEGVLGDPHLKEALAPYC